MLVSEKLAMAAHLHVLLRRKTGRVTDTEWMASNAEYAMEIVRFARAKAQEDGHPDLAEWADKLEKATVETASAKSPRQPLAQTAMKMLREHATAPAPLQEPATPVTEQTGGFRASVFGESGFADSSFGGKDGKPRDPNAPRYVGGIR